MTLVNVVVSLAHIYTDRSAENRFRVDVAYALSQKLSEVGLSLESCDMVRSYDHLGGIEVRLQSELEESRFWGQLTPTALEQLVLGVVEGDKVFSKLQNAHRIMVTYQSKNKEKNTVVSPVATDINVVVSKDIEKLRSETHFDRYQFESDVAEQVVAESLLEIPVGERKSVLALAALRAQKSGHEEISFDDLKTAADVVLQRKSDVGADYIEQLAGRFIPRKPRFTFETIIIPQEMIEALSDAVALSSADILAKYDKWGLNELDPNPRAILNFYGPPGTGKTHAAEALADKMQCDIISVGCKELESKWLGEGPKNVAAAFLAARRSGAILFFDEADGLISQRQLQEQSGGENQLNAVKNAMLTEVETHKGVVIFASNFVSKYDSAFATRIQGFEFLAPTRSELVRIWEKKIPMSVPGREKLDFDGLADFTFKYAFCGRDVRNAAVRAFKSVLRRGQECILQEDLIYACKMLVEDRKNMEKKNGHLNTLNVNAEDHPVEESAKALGKAVNEFITTNRTTTETKETK